MKFPSKALLLKLFEVHFKHIYINSNINNFKAWFYGQSNSTKILDGVIVHTIGASLIERGLKLI
jgi:hypothetical protein